MHVVKLVNVPKAFAIRVHDVKEILPTADLKDEAIRWVKEKLTAIHPYLFKPSISHDAQQRRLEEFLAPAIGDAANTGAARSGPDDDEGNFG